MAKQKKKRNKVYQGAATQRPIVTRISAANRNSVQQWWFDKKRIAKPALITAGIAIVVLWLLSELLRLVF
jgi:hypothetical protein